MSESLVLIVEDEPDIADLIRFHVEREGMASNIVHSGKTALEVVERRHPELIVLDLMLPDLDGLEVCRHLKWEKQTRSIPILIVSARGEESDIVAGLELGADDYVSKPFSPKVLMARIKTILRRGSVTEQTEQDTKRISRAGGELVIDIDRHQVTVSDRPIDLTPTEFGILHCLASRPGFVRTRDQIISAVHGQNTVLSSRTIDVHVTSIRRKLGDLGQLIETVRGIGYRMTESIPTAGVEL